MEEGTREVKFATEGAVKELSKLVMELKEEVAALRFKVSSQSYVPFGQEPYSLPNRGFQEEVIPMWVLGSDGPWPHAYVQ